MVLAAALAVVLGWTAGCSSVPTGSPDAARLAPVRQLHQRGGRLGWDGLVLGMSYREIEVAVGKKLPPPETPEPPGNVGCEHPSLRTELLGTRLVLEFSGTFEDSRLVALWAILAAPDRSLDPAALRAAVRDRVHALEFVPDPLRPGVAEEASYRAVYAVHGGGRVVVDPARGVYFGDVCVE